MEAGSDERGQRHDAAGEPGSRERQGGSMTIWIWRDCEPLPTDPGARRLMRAGMFSQRLAAAGHRVRWFNSTFDHYQKRHRDTEPGSYELSDGVTLELVKGLGYRSNGSPSRFVHNLLSARRFTDRGRALRAGGEIPDVMVMDMPLPETAAAGVKLASEWGIPSVVCIRDVWPDFFLRFLPRSVVWAAGPFVWHMDRIVRTACANATSIVGISKGYLDWGLAKAGRKRRDTDPILPLGYSPERVSGNLVRAQERLEAKGVDFSKSLAIFIGSWGYTYDIDLLLAAAEGLSHRDDIQFVITGSGEQADLIAARAPALKNAVFPGWVDRDEIGVLVQRAAVGLSPYRHAAPQGMPNKLFEYMSAGLFQVATLAGESADLLSSERLGQTVPARDREAFAAAVLQAVDSGQPPEERERIRRYFDDHFDADRVYGDYTTHLERLVAAHRRQETAGG